MLAMLTISGGGQTIAGFYANRLMARIADSKSVDQGSSPCSRVAFGRIISLFNWNNLVCSDLEGLIQLPFLMHHDRFLDFIAAVPPVVGKLKNS